MDLQKTTKEFVRMVARDLDDAFDQNFDKESFFGKKWKSTMFNTGNKILGGHGGSGLRGSLDIAIRDNSIQWTSNLPYASIHNEGGEIQVTAKMKSFFWAMYYKAGGAAKSKGKRGKRMAGEAAKWKALALMKPGSKITIPQRQFIGWDPEVDTRIAEVLAYQMNRYNKDLRNKLKRK